MIGWTGAIIGVFFYLSNTILGVILFFSSGYTVGLFNLILLDKQKINKQILGLNLICGVILITCSFILLTFYFLILMERILVLYLFQTLPFCAGGFLIAHSIRFYRKRNQEITEEPALPLFPRRFFYLAFILISIIGTGIFLCVVTEDVVLWIIGFFTAFMLCLIPLNYLIRRYFISISSQIDEELLNKWKKFVLVGLVIVISLFFLIVVLYVGEFNVPPNILLASLLITFEIFVVLYYILKYFYFPEKLR